MNNNDKVSNSGNKNNTKSSLKRQNKEPNKNTNPSFNLNESQSKAKLTKNQILSSTKKFSSSKKIMQPNSLDFPQPQYIISNNNNYNNNNNYERLYLKNIDEPTKLNTNSTYGFDHAALVTNMQITNKSQKIQPIKYNIDNERSQNFNNKSSVNNSRVHDKFQNIKSNPHSKSPINRSKVDSNPNYHTAVEDKYELEKRLLSKSKHHKTSSNYASSYYDKNSVSGISDIYSKQKNDINNYRDIKSKYSKAKRKSSDMGLSSNSTSHNFNSMSNFNNNNNNINNNNLIAKFKSLKQPSNSQVSAIQPIGHSSSMSENFSNFSYLNINPNNHAIINNMKEIVIDDRKFSIIDIPGLQAQNLVASNIINKINQDCEKKRSKRLIIKEQVKNKIFKDSKIKALFLLVTNNICPLKLRYDLMTGIKPLFIMYHPGNLIRDLLVTYKKKYLEIEDYFTKYITDLSTENAIKTPFVPTNTAIIGINCLTQTANNKLLESSDPLIIKMVEAIRMLDYTNNQTKSLKYLILEDIIPNTSRISVSEVFKYNELVNDCLKMDHEKVAIEANYLHYIIKELYYYFNIKTKDNILIVKLRRLAKQKSDYRNKIENLKKHWFDIHD